jgi:hypothetical protein
MLGSEEFVLARLTPHGELILTLRWLIAKGEVVGSTLDTLPCGECEIPAAAEALHANVFFELF